jgi:hypothetical protein
MSIVFTAKDLRALTKEAQEDSSMSPQDLAELWLYWFRKRGERYLSNAAKFGYTEVTLDLPLALARTLHKGSLRALLRELRQLVPGCSVCIVEEEYEGQILFKVEISWAAPKSTQSDSSPPSSAAPSPPAQSSQSDTPQCCSTPETQQTSSEATPQCTAADAPPESH